MAVFMRSYTPAMRSNMARTCAVSSRPEGRPRAAGSVAADPLAPLARAPAPAPGWAGIDGTLLPFVQKEERGGETLRRQVPERGHRRGRINQRARDAVERYACTDVGQVGTGPVVTVFAELVARQATGLRHDSLARFEFRQHRATGLDDPGRRGHADRGRVAGVGALVGE